MKRDIISSLNKKRILITGGCGFLGSNLAKRLVSIGANLTIFIRPQEDRKNVSEIENKIKIIEGDLLNEDDVRSAISGTDYLFHFAWQTDLKKSMENPISDLNSDVAGLLNILEVCRKNNPSIKIIFTSTVTVIGDSNKIPSNEDEKEEPLSIYEINKLAAEKYLKMYYKIYGLKTTTLRLSNVFGEGQSITNPNRGVLNFMIGRALRGEKLTVYGKGDFIRDYNYVQNYIDAFILAAASDKTNGEVFVLGSGEGRTFEEVVISIKKITEEVSDKKVEIVHVHFPEGTHQINKRNFIADASKFKEATGWSPRFSFEEGLRRTILFYLK